MSEFVMVKCTCGREYNAGSLDKCPACGTPSRGATPVATAEPVPSPNVARAATLPSTGPSASIEQRMLAEMQEQTKMLRRLWWAVIGVGIICLVAFYLNGVKVNLSPTAFQFTNSGTP